MRIFLAGATGVIGIRLVPLLARAGHEVAGMTRSQGKADLVRSLGAEPVVVDVYEQDRLVDAVATFRPDAVIHELTDLPDERAQLGGRAAANARIRTEGTRNLLAAANAAAVSRFLAQSIAWQPSRHGEAVAEHERLVLEAGGVVLRYGRFYGPGTYYEQEPPDPPRIHVDAAARRTVEALAADPGIVVIEEGPISRTT